MLVKEVRSIFEQFEGFAELEGWFKDNADQDFADWTMTVGIGVLEWAATVLDLQQALAVYKAVEKSAWDSYQENQKPAWKTYMLVHHRAWKKYNAAMEPAWDAYWAAEAFARRDLALAVIAKIECLYTARGE